MDCFTAQAHHLPAGNQTCRNALSTYFIPKPQQQGNYEAVFYDYFHLHSLHISRQFKVNF